MSERSENSELERLLAHACDGILDADEAPLLARHLATDPAARNAYLEAIALDCLLQAEHADSLLEVTLAEQARATAGDAPAGNTTRSISNRLVSKALSFTSAPNNPRTLHLLLSLAAGLLLLASGTHAWIWAFDDTSVLVAQRPTLTDDRPVGRIADVFRAEWDAAYSITSEQLLGGQRLKLNAGVAKLHLDQDVVVTVEGPAELEIASDGLLLAKRGAIHARAGAAAEGFVIQTPSTQIVKVGPDAGAGGKDSGVGLEIDDTGATDVVVFDGQVELQYVKGSVFSTRQRRPVEDISFRDLRTVRYLSMGEGLHIERSGDVRRIVSVDSERFPRVESLPTRSSEPVIRRVSDDIRDAGSSHYYQIVRGGLGEDARAFVDRLHEWNGLDHKGMPAELVGADYVKTFNADKWSADLNLHVDLAAAATLYVFFDNRVPTPTWLAERFEDTGWDLGLDEGWVGRNGQGFTLSRTGRLVSLPEHNASTPWAGQSFETPVLASPDITLPGQGISIDAEYSVWRLHVPRAARITLGPPGRVNERTCMYGVAATPW